jgi:2'-5' RNA ligase
VGKVDTIAASVAGAAASFAPFEVATGGGGGRPGGQRGGVAWLRLSTGAEEVGRLSLAIDRAIGSAFYAVIDPRPHLTLARGVDERVLDDVRGFAQGLDLRWTVDRVVLFRSHTDPSGSRYEELRSFPLE